MNFYQELQLNQAGSKSYIASFKNPKDKCKHIAVYLFKIALVVAFCVSFASFAQEESRSISENVKWGTKKRFEQGIPNGHFQIYGYRWEGDHLVVEPKEAKIVKLIFDNFMNGLSAESTEKQLEEMGVKSYKGVHFSNSSIRQILSNVTYTGNLLFQKEYVSDPITGKSKKNNGEMPQYWVENTHEAIIPMEIFQAVQKERQRRRELGVLANWSINTSCFTSKIKCPICGKSYRRSGKRQRKDSNEVYYIWICRTKSEKGAKFCDAKSIPEKKLKAVCAEALGLNEFDETQFSERVRQITVIGDDTLEFYFTDGTVIQKKWKSTAKTDWWTEERKKEWGERHKNKFRNPNRAFYNEFTGFIKCGNCGENYRSQGKTYADGTKDRYWRCSESCGNTAIKHSTVQALVCDVLGIKKFSEEQMDAVIEKAVVSNGLVTFCFKDGHTESREYEEKKKGIPHTEEYKRYMSQYRKVVYRCNHKYKDEKCQTPHVTEDEIKALFIKAYNELISEKKEIIANAELIRKTLCTTDGLLEEKQKLEDEILVLVEMTQNVVAENARVAQDQEEYQKRYDGLVQRYETTKKEYNELVDKIEQKEAHGERIRQFIKTLKDQDGIITEFDDVLWGSMVELVTISREKRSVTFKDGTEIQL